MAFSTDFIQADRLASVIGLPATLTLCGFFGKSGQRVYVPIETTPDHILQKLIGTEAFKKLVATHAGECLAIPEVDLTTLRRAGMVYRLSRREIPVSDIALATGCNPRTVHLIRAALRLEGFSDLADSLPDDAKTEGGGL